MTTATFPQYAKTTHPDVIAAIEKIDQQYAEFIEKCRDLSREFVGHPDATRIHGWKLDGYNVTGLDASEVRKASIGGDWIKPTPQGYTRPKKSDPQYERFQIGYQAEPIPGRHRGGCNVIWGDGYFGVGACFVHNGAVYSGFRFQPTELIEDSEEFGWTEIKASEYHAAVEAVQE